MPGYSPDFPGELNAHSTVESDVCVEYCLTGRCPLEAQGVQCRRRHLFWCHPECIALFFFHNRLSERDIAAWGLTRCPKNEMNPFSNPKEKLCFDFVNLGYCKRNREGKICRFRHLF